MRSPATPGLVLRGERIAVAFAAAAYLLLVCFRDGTFIWLLSQQEGGIWLDEGLRVLRGERIYRDFFDFIAPGNVFLIAGWLWLFGEGVGAVAGLVVATGVAVALLVHAVAAWLLPLAWRLMATTLFLAYSYQPYSPLNHKWPTLLLCLCGLLLLLPRRSHSRCAGAGALLAAASSCTQDMGAGAAVGLGAALLLLTGRESWRPFAAYCAGYATALLAISGAIVAYAGAEAWWYHLYEFAATRYLAFYALYFGEPHAAVRTFTVYGLGVCGFLFTIRALASRSLPGRAALLLVGLAGLGLLLGSVVRPIEPVAFSVRAMPLILVGLHAVRVVLQPRGMERIAATLLALSLAAVIILQGVHAGWTRPLVRTEHRAGAVWEPPAMADLAWLERHAARDAPVFLFPYKGGYEFLSRTRNVSTFPLMMDRDFTTPVQLQRAAAQVAAACPLVGIWDHGRLIHPVGRSSLTPLYEALSSRYERDDRLPEGVELMRLKRERQESCRASQEAAR